MHEASPLRLRYGGGGESDGKAKKADYCPNVRSPVGYQSQPKVPPPPKHRRREISNVLFSTSVASIMPTVPPFLV